MKTFDCANCNAPLEFQPEVDELQCPYCDTIVPIPESETEIIERDYRAFVRELSKRAPRHEIKVVKCDGCGAEAEFKGQKSAGQCAYCDTPLVAGQTSATGLRPTALLPFKVSQDRALSSFRGWLRGLWFAPNKLKQYANRGEIQGRYIPYWTYDANTDSRYRGERGDAYYETQRYTDAEGKQQTRQVRKVRWSSASGRVYERFDDILILASQGLPRRYADALAPWDLHALEGYRDEYVVGFQAERYGVSLEAGYEHAEQIMAAAIDRLVRRGIGGDEQRVFNIDTATSNIRFKHILLPIWISSYRYSGKVYRFLVNARSGEVQGERPWSWIKITLLVLAIAAVIGVIMSLER